MQALKRATDLPEVTLAAAELRRAATVSLRGVRVPVDLRRVEVAEIPAVLLAFGRGRWCVRRLPDNSEAASTSRQGIECARGIAPVKGYRTRILVDLADSLGEPLPARAIIGRAVAAAAGRLDHEHVAGLHLVRCRRAGSISTLPSARLDGVASERARRAARDAERRVRRGCSTASRPSSARGSGRLRTPPLPPCQRPGAAGPRRGSRSRRAVPG